jgi:hypothetical protein
MDATETVVVKRSLECRRQIQDLHAEYEANPCYKVDDIEVYVRRKLALEINPHDDDPVLSRPCNSYMICNRVTGSNTFRRMLESEPCQKFVYMPQVHYQMFTPLMNFIYSGALRVRTVDVPEMLEAAIFLQMDELTRQTINLLSEDLTVDKAASNLGLATHLNKTAHPYGEEMDAWIKKCVAVIRAHPGPLPLIHAFPTLEFATACGIQDIAAKCVSDLQAVEKSISWKTVRYYHKISRNFRLTHKPSHPNIFHFEKACSTFMFDQIVGSEKFYALSFEEFKELLNLAHEMHVEHPSANNAVRKWNTRSLGAASKTAKNNRSGNQLKPERNTKRTELYRYVHDLYGLTT